MENDNNINNVNENLSEEKAQDKNTKRVHKKRFNLFNPFKNKYVSVKAEEERKKKTILFGLLAIIFSLASLALCYPCVWLGLQGMKFGFTHFLGFFTYFFLIGHIFIISLSFGVTLIPYYLWFQSIRLVIMQFFLNRRFISWLALLIWLVTVFGIFLLSLESFLVITGLGHVFE